MGSPRQAHQEARQRVFLAPEGVGLGWVTKAPQRAAYALRALFFLASTFSLRCRATFRHWHRPSRPSFLADRAARRRVGGAAKRGEGLPSHRGVEFEPRSG